MPAATTFSHLYNNVKYIVHCLDAKLEKTIDINNRHLLFRRSELKLKPSDQHDNTSRHRTRHQTRRATRVHTNCDARSDIDGIRAVVRGEDSTLGNDSSRHTEMGVESSAQKSCTS